MLTGFLPQLEGRKSEREDRNRRKNKELYKSLTEKMLPTKTQDRETEKWEEKKKKKNKKTQNLGLVSILAKGPMVLVFFEEFPVFFRI